MALTLLWVVIGVAAVAVVLLFAVMDRAKHEDRRSRHIQHGINPFDSITITRPGK